MAVRAAEMLAGSGRSLPPNILERLAEIASSGAHPQIAVRAARMLQDRAGVLSVEIFAQLSAIASGDDSVAADQAAHVLDLARPLPDEVIARLVTIVANIDNGASLESEPVRQPASTISSTDPVPVLVNGLFDAEPRTVGVARCALLELARHRPHRKEIMRSLSDRIRAADEHRRAAAYAALFEIAQRYPTSS